MMHSFQDSDLPRRLNNLIKLGTVEEVDYKNAKVHVKTVSDTSKKWLSWITCRAGEDRSWSAPSVGEQVIVLSPEGDTTQGIVLPAIYYDAKYPSPNFFPEENKKPVSGFVFKDGTLLYYDRNSHKLMVSVKEEGTLIFNVKETITEITGKEITSQLGKSSLKITGEKITLQVGESSLEITENGIKLNAKRIDLN